MNETLKRRTLLVLCLCFGLAAAACTPEEPPLKGAKLGGPFALTDQNGGRVSDRNFAGKYRIVYFGFTHCPDVCPTDLAVIGQALALHEKENPSVADKVQPIFITVDPERDRPEVLKAYVESFHPRLIGLTGTPAQIAAVAKAHAIYFKKLPPGPDGGYALDHSRLVMLFGPQGEPIALLPFEDGAKKMAAELERWVR